MRIHVTGNAGAGKTTFAASLGAALDLPVHSLDSIVWQPGWTKTPAPQRLAAERDLIAEPDWIIEGVSSTVRQASDWVLFLDTARSVCLWRGLKRNLRYFTRTRPGLPPGCPEWRILPRLMGIIRRFPSHAGLAIRREAALDPDRYRILRHHKEIEVLFRDLSAARPEIRAASVVRRGA